VPLTTSGGHLKEIYPSWHSGGQLTSREGAGPPRRPHITLYDIPGDALGAAYAQLDLMTARAPLTTSAATTSTKVHFPRCPNAPLAPHATRQHDCWALTAGSRSCRLGAQQVGFIHAPHHHTAGAVSPVLLQLFSNACPILQQRTPGTTRASLQPAPNPQRARPGTFLAAAGCTLQRIKHPAMQRSSRFTHHHPPPTGAAHHYTAAIRRREELVVQRQLYHRLLQPTQSRQPPSAGRMPARCRTNASAAPQPRPMRATGVERTVAWHCVHRRRSGLAPHLCKRRRATARTGGHGRPRRQQC
jgi:hypothetical protein